MKKFSMISEIRKLAKAHKLATYNKAKRERKKMIFTDIGMSLEPKSNAINNEAKKRLDAALGLLKLKESEDRINF